ncbi:MAG: glucose-1-phosphate cytidylyltransferase [Pseudomonadota bacterium]
MKVVLLAGGFGTRISEESAIRPKPMVEVGGRPILWHIMRHYARFGHNDFVILGGYKVDFIQDYFLKYFRSNSDFTIDTSTGEITWSRSRAEKWRVTVLDTGVDTMTGGRLKRAQDIIGDDRFLLTYGDGVSDVDIDRLVAFHENAEAWMTLTAVSQPGRFGALGLTPDKTRVRTFREKAADDGGLINGGYFVCERQLFDVIEDDSTILERDPMDALVAEGKLASYHHAGYWQNMDTLRDKSVLEEVWATGNAPWKA